MIKLTFKDFLKIDVLLVFLFLIVPMVGYLNYVFRGFFLTWPIFILWLIFILVKNKNLHSFFKLLYDRLIYFALLLIFVWVVGLNHFFVETNSKSLQYFLVYINFFLIYIIDCYYSVKPVKERYAIIYLLVITLGVQAIISIPYILNTSIPIARYFSAGWLSPAERMEALKNGIGNNGLYSSISIFVFSFIAIIKNTVFNSWKFLGIASIIALVISSIISAFVASILLLIVGVLLIFLFTTKLKLVILIRNLVLTMVLIFVLLASFQIFMKESDTFRYQTRKIEAFLSYEGVMDPTGRTQLIRVSIDSFFNNPLTGIGVPDWQSYSRIGGHTTWVDYLAHFGILGVLPLYIFLLLRSLNRIKAKHDRYVNSSHVFFFNISIVLFFIGNFISPLITHPNNYIMFLFLFTAIQIPHSVSYDE